VAKRMGLLYGPPLCGKSSAILRALEALCKETGKKARVAVGDGSAVTYTDSGLVDAGVIELADFSIRPEPLSTMRQFAEGAWPEDPEDPNSPMIALTAAKAAEYCANVFEGIAVGAQYVSGDKPGGLADRGAKGEKIGQDSPIRIKDEKSKLEFGGNPMSHFGVAQRQVLSWIERSKMLPGFVYWTTHERVAEDKIAQEPIVGPEVIGSALTANLARYFSDLLHFTTAMTTKKVTDPTTKKSIDIVDVEYRMYTRDHMDPDGTTFKRFRAGARTPMPADMPPYLVGDKDDPFNVLVKYYATLAKAKQKNLLRAGFAQQAPEAA